MAAIFRVCCALVAVTEALVPLSTTLRSARPRAELTRHRSDRTGEYTLIGSDGKETLLSTKEKEQIFLDAIQSYYFSGRQLLTDVDFDQLKEDLAWEGSEYAALSRNETKFLGAMAAYSKGEPMMSDGEFDDLKASLKQQGSLIAVTKEPRCFLDTGVCSVSFAEDKFRKIVLYLPAALIATLLWSGGTYELIPQARSLNPLLTLLLGSPLIFSLAQFLTERVIFDQPFIATGPCPDCGASQRIFFGDILGVDGPGDNAEFACTNCKAALTVKRDTLRVSTKPKPA